MDPHFELLIENGPHSNAKGHRLDEKE